MNTVLIFYYETEEKIEYPDPNCLGTIRWHEIEYVEFETYTQNQDGTYSITDYPHLREPISFDEICDIQYSNYLRVLHNEALQMNNLEERDYLFNELKTDYESLYTLENRAWIDFWLLYHQSRWRNEYEQRKAAARAAE